MSINDNPYAPASGAQMSTSVSFGGATEPQTSTAIAADLVLDTTTADFDRDVIQASRSQPVLVDFWAPWCGPCKQLTPIIEKAVKDAKGRVRLVKLNIDDHPAIPGQMGIQSIPAVVAFVNGKPVDGFMGALPDSQVRQFIDRVAGPQQPDQAEVEIARVMEESRAALAAGETDRAAEGFSAILEIAEGHVGAVVGLATCMISIGDLDQAEQLLAVLDEASRKDADAVSAQKRLEMAREVARLGDPSAFEARLEANPLDHEARIGLAKILSAQGDRDGAAAQLFTVMRKDRGFDDDAARKTLIDFFQAWGPMDPSTLSARRQLSSLLFS